MIVIAQTSLVSLVASREDLRRGELRVDGEVALAMDVAPGWRNPSPVATAELALACLRPHPPRFIADTGDGPVTARGFYRFRDDVIGIRNRSRFEPLDIAGTIFHELAHCTGHPSRLGRFHIPERDLHPSEVDPLVIRQEEGVADLAAFLVAVRVGIEADWRPAIENLAGLPAERARAAIEQATAAAGYILNL